jgi:ATP-dependent protease ClpP protease subunit
MSKQYVERLTSEPAVMVICMGQAVALGLGVLTAGAAAKKSKKK